jgi:hypothetical protein
MGAVTAAEVCTHMGMDEATLTAQDDAHLAAVVGAVNAMVPDTVPRVRLMEDPAAAWEADIQQAAVMQAARLFARRNSPTGVAAYSETGATFVSRWDPDVERLLRIGSWTPPQAR